MTPCSGCSCCRDDDTAMPLPWDNGSVDLDDKAVHNDETVFYVVGTGPLVLTVPHGGTLRPSKIPNRTSGCMEPDTHSAQLAWAVFHHYNNKNNGQRAATDAPVCSVVIGKLHRSKVDLARPRESAAESDQGRAAWDDYHTAIQTWLDWAIQRHGHAHLVDIHGQSHRDMTEVGHMLTNSDLRDHLSRNETTSATAANLPLLLEKSSVAAMATLPIICDGQINNYNWLQDVVRGPHAMGTSLDTAGYAAVPSWRIPFPCCYDCESVVQTQPPNSTQGGTSVNAPCSSDCCCHAPTTTTTKNGNDDELTTTPRNFTVTRPCTGFDVQAWRQKTCPKNTNTNGDCGFGPCSFFWGSNTLCMYGGGRIRKRDSQPSQLPKYRGKVAATQLETAWAGARETPDQIDQFGAALAEAIHGFMKHFYGAS